MVKPTNPISITFISTTLGPAGAEWMLYRLLSRIDRKRFTPRVIALIDFGPSSVVQAIQALGVSIRFLGMQPGLPNPMFVLRLARWLREDQPDLISTWMYHADLIGGIAARLAGGIPVVWGIRQSDLNHEGNSHLTYLTVKICGSLSRWLPAKIICNSEAGRKFHVELGYASEKMVVIPNGYDLGTFRPDSAARETIRKELQLSNEVPIVGLMARFHPQKDHPNFVLAASLLHQDRPDVHFVLCGHGMDWENTKLTKWIEEAGIRSRFHLLGLRNDVPKLIAALDIACMSSSFGEGFPNVVSEAMCCEVPCVVTDVGDAAYIVGNTGRVVEPRNPNALAKALLELIELGPEGRSQLGIAARQRISEHFDLPKVVKQYESLFEELACGK